MYMYIHVVPLTCSCLEGEKEIRCRLHKDTIRVSVSSLPTWWTSHVDLICASHLSPFDFDRLPFGPSSSPSIDLHIGPVLGCALSSLWRFMLFAPSSVRGPPSHRYDDALGKISLIWANGVGCFTHSSLRYFCLVRTS
jgi:hypothetical protein